MRPFLFGEHMNVLSLCDGMSGAMAALKHLGIKPTNYFASEIDKYAESVSKFHYPEIIRLGDINKVDFFGLPKIDLLVAGFPCQSFSFAGKQLNFDDPRGKIFFEVVRLLNELQPKYFLLENVIMKKDIEAKINELIGIKPVVINSALLTAQNRKRNYWVGGYKDGKVYRIDIPQPEDLGILLKDIIVGGDADREKSLTVTSRVGVATAERYLDKSMHQMIKIVNVNPSGNGMNGNVFSIEGKCPTLTTNKGEGIKITNSVIPSPRVIDDSDITEEEFNRSVERFRLIIGGAQRGRYLVDGKRADNTVDSMTGLTEQRLELRNDGKSNCLSTVQNHNNKQVVISNSQRYKMIGNGFTMLVIAHILKSMNMKITKSTHKPAYGGFF